MTQPNNHFKRELVTIDGKKYVVHSWDDPDELVPCLRVLQHVNGRRVKDEDQYKLLAELEKGGE